MSRPHPDLTAPGPLPARGLRVIPLGGLGDVGRNMTVFEYDGRLLLVDRLTDPRAGLLILLSRPLAQVPR